MQYCLHLLGLDNTFFMSQIVVWRASNYLWIGGEKFTSAGIWQWSGVGESMTVGDWMDNEPSGNGNCIKSWRDKTFGWDDENCARNYYFVCESFAT